MKQLIALTLALLWLAFAIGAAVYLVKIGHPCFAAVLILIIASVRISWSEKS
jgi:hypothetical protein